MKSERFSEEQIVGILKRHEAGQKVGDLAREVGISEATIYAWKSAGWRLAKHCAGRLFGPLMGGRCPGLFGLLHSPASATSKSRPGPTLVD